MATLYHLEAAHSGPLLDLAVNPQPLSWSGALEFILTLNKGINVIPMFFQT